ncbi:nucleoside recognition domain-containing protein [Pontibacter sp. BAB1700]|uniref:nucleoside recognition domain-containing protein n=1 Tax=Pontibacter sp. BAB1700 TaxID=1144253 RepID=UPI00026BC166|nr:spore maturation protein [Pontibacter sp. BAB1700]EJF10722.1 nucleoside recognition domain-containing protein [Pontibacter sp. BAB1700]
MVLNYLWAAFFLIAFAIALFQLIVFRDVEIFQKLVSSTFDNAKLGFEISLGLTGVMTLWLGLMKVGERGGIIAIFSRLVAPFFNRLFPEIPKNHPVFGSILMNFSANMLGLDNAATPLGLKAMKEMQELNPIKERASNAQIMFLVLNTSGLTIIPISIMVFRAQLGAADPSDIFIPILLATFFSTMVGLIAVALYQRINLFNPVILTYIGTLLLLIGGLIYYFSTISQEQVSVISQVASNVILFSIIISFVGLALIRKVNVYEAFIEGAKEGFTVAITIIPYLVAILVAIGVFRTSGALDMIVDGIGFLIALTGVNTDFVPALPIAFMKPLSGSGARGLMVEAMTTYGVDSFVGRMASVFQGSTETTFYVLAVYFGSVGIKRSRYALTCGLLADFAGAIAAIFIAYLFFH